MTVLDDLSNIKSKLDRLAKEKLKTEAEIERLEAERLSSLSQLKNNFGVDSVDEAESLLSNLTDELEREIERLDGAVREIDV